MWKLRSRWKGQYEREDGGRSRRHSVRLWYLLKLSVWGGRQRCDVVGKQKEEQARSWDGKKLGMSVSEGKRSVGGQGVTDKQRREDKAGSERQGVESSERSSEGSWGRGCHAKMFALAVCIALATVFVFLGGAHSWLRLSLRSSCIAGDTVSSPTMETGFSEPVTAWSQGLERAVALNAENPTFSLLRDYSYQFLGYCVLSLWNPYVLLVQYCLIWPPIAFVLLYHCLLLLTSHFSFNRTV